MSEAPRTGLRQGMWLSLASALTTWLAMLSWSGFAETSSSYLAPLLIAAVLVGVLGATLRWWRVPFPVVALAQLVVVGGYVSLAVPGSLIPVGDGWREFQLSWQAAVEAAQAYSSPVPARFGGLEPVLLPLGALCLLIVDVIACGWRRVPLAGLALLTIYAVGVSVLAGDVSWLTFALTAIGYLVMLYLFEDDYVARWGRGFGGRTGDEDAGGFGVRTGAVRATAVGVGGVATAAAIVLPLAIPTLQLGVFEGGIGPGNGDVTVDNPIVDLRRDLNRGNDVALLQIETDDPSPEYLRISVLARFNGEEWTSGDRDIPADQLADGVLPPLPGVTRALDRTEYAYQVSVLPAFRSRWLPVMSTTTFVEADGDWRYDRDTMDFVAADDNTNAEALDYSLRAVELDLHADDMAAAPDPVGSLVAKFTGLPASVPAQVRVLAGELTEDTASDYERAVILQNWFRRDGDFTYSLERAPEGNGTDELLEFLDDRVGYCEQFASAMAVMARSLGIPARVAVGFLKPDPLPARGSAVGDEPQVYEYSAWDLHAWPELYFPGSGWVRFEPTPGTRSNAFAPAYTREDIPDAVDATPSDTVTRSATGDPLAERTAEATGDLSAEDRAGQDDGLLPGLGTVLLTLAGVAALATLVLLPGWWRRWRRERRWEAGLGPEAAWLELRDTAIDHGRPWPAGLSPQAAALRVSDWFGDPEDHRPTERPGHGPDYAPQAVAALGRLVGALERSRYARSYDGEGEASLRADTELVADAIIAGTPPRARRRARWLPASVLRRRRPRRAAERVEVTDQGGVVDHVG